MSATASTGRRSQGRGIWVFFLVVGCIGLIWAVVDIVNLGPSHVPGSTWLCLAMSIVVAVGSVYREFGGTPLVTFDDEPGT